MGLFQSREEAAVKLFYKTYDKSFNFAYEVLRKENAPNPVRDSTISSEHEVSLTRAARAIKEKYGITAHMRMFSESCLTNICLRYGFNRDDLIRSIKNRKDTQADTESRWRLYRDLP